MHPSILLKLTFAILKASRTGRIAIVSNRKGKAFVGVERVKKAGSFPFKMLTVKGEDVTDLILEAMSD